MKNKNILKLILTLVISSMIFSSVSIGALADTEYFIESFEGGGISIRTSYSHITYKAETAEDAITIPGREDTSSVFTVGTKKVNVTHTSGMKYYIPNTAKLYTIETSVYFDGNARPSISAMWDDDLTQSTLLKVDEDGYVWYNNNTSTLKSDVVLMPGTWNIIAFGYDPSRVRFSLYVNGELIGNMTYMYNQAQADEVWVGVAPISTDGRVAYDDLKGYYGEYDTSKVSVPTISSTSEYARIDGGDIVYENTEFDSFSSLESAFETSNVEKSVLYTDASMKNESQGEIGDGYVYVITSSSGISKIYTLKLPALNVDYISFSDTDEDLAVTSYVTYEGVISKNAIMVVVVKDEQGRIEKLFATEEKEISSSPTSFEITLENCAGKSAEAFFIDGWNSRISYQAVTHKN